VYKPKKASNAKQKISNLTGLSIPADQKIFEVKWGLSTGDFNLKFILVIFKYHDLE